MATIRGDRGDDILHGTSGADRISGLAGSDVLDGAGGSDTLLGGGDPDALRGGRGADLLDGGRGADALDGGEGFDTATYAGLGRAVAINLDLGTASAGGETDTLLSVEGFVGTARGDLFESSLVQADNVVRGGAGDDAIDDQDGGTDRFFGEAGDDDITDFNGGDDLLSGGDGDDALSGNEGDDLLVGGRGDDFLISQFGGEDVHVGGPGGDDFFWSVLSGTSGPLLIADFGDGRDELIVQNDVFDGDALAGALDSDGSGRLDAGDAFVRVAPVTFRGSTERSTLLDVGALVADAQGTSDTYVPGSGVVTLFGISGLPGDLITGTTA